MCTAISTAIIAAITAIVVALLTQWILARRARTEHLTAKLEELYLTLNEASTNHMKLLEDALHFAAEGRAPGLNWSDFSGEREAPDLHKKTLMLVHLYFPELLPIHEQVFSESRKIQQSIEIIKSGTGVPYEHLTEQSGMYKNALEKMEREIINQKNSLTKSSP